MSIEPIRLQEWLDLYGKWVHFQLQPPKESHDVMLVARDGKLAWTGPLHASAEQLDFEVDAFLVDVRYDEPETGDEIAAPEFKGGRFTITLQLPTIGGVLIGKPETMPSED